MNKSAKVGAAAVIAAAASFVLAGCADPTGEYCVQPAAKVAPVKGMAGKGNQGNSCSGHK